MIAASRQAALGMVGDLNGVVIEIAGLTRARLLVVEGQAVVLIPLGLSRQATERQILAELMRALVVRCDYGALLALVRLALDGHPPLARRGASVECGGG
jgi:hypothetical protein